MAAPSLPESSVRRIVITDDQVFERRGLHVILQSGFPDFVVVESASAQELWQLLGEYGCELLVLAMTTANVSYAETLGRLREQYPQTKVLAVAAVCDFEYGIRLMRAGAHGYITRYVSSEELLSSVHRVLEGNTYFCSDSPAGAAQRSVHEALPPSRAGLSERELEVLRCLALGHSIKQVAHELSLSEKTVETYVSRIRKKTGLQNYVDMARYALRHGLVE